MVCMAYISHYHKIWPRIPVTTFLPVYAIASVMGLSHNNRYDAILVCFTIHRILNLFYVYFLALYTYISNPVKPVLTEAILVVVCSLLNLHLLKGNLRKGRISFFLFFLKMTVVVTWLFLICNQHLLKTNKISSIWFLHHNHQFLKMKPSESWTLLRIVDIIPE